MKKTVGFFICGALFLVLSICVCCVVIPLIEVNQLAVYINKNISVEEGNDWISGEDIRNLRIVEESYLSNEQYSIDFHSKPKLKFLTVTEFILYYDLRVDVYDWTTNEKMKTFSATKEITISYTNFKWRVVRVI